MVDFGTGTYTPINRGYGAWDAAKEGTNDVGVVPGVIPVRDIGFSVPFGVAAQNVQGVAAKIRTGVRKIELQFFGTGHGNRQSQTPGMYGEMQRQALREIAKANEVDFVTHASGGIMGLAGMDQQGNFSKQNRKFSMDELKRAIDFAADVARGGNVVIHTGEFQRPISEQPWAWRDPDKKTNAMFTGYEDEAKRAVYRVVDERTGQVVLQVRKNKDVARPIWKMAKEGQEYVDFDGNKRTAGKDDEIYVDYFNKQVDLPARVPEYDEAKKHISVEMWNWGKIEHEAKLRTERARKFWRENRHNRKKMEESEFVQFMDAASENEVEVTPDEAYVLATLETQEANSKGWAIYYAGDFNRDLDILKKLQKAKETFEKIEKSIPEDEQWKLLRQSTPEELHGLIPPEYRKPSEAIAKAIDGYERRVSYAKESSKSQAQQSRDITEEMKYIMTAEKYALKESFGAYANVGLHAMAKSQELEKQGKLREPIFVAMENIFPENYGGHPDELMTLVKGSRTEMAKRLMDVKGYSKEQADKFAETHIKAHLDTGHLNMWRKHWQWDKTKTPQENDQAFNEWMFSKVEEMAKQKMVGSVHLTDNYGYHDEHLSPGQGNAQVKEMVTILKKHGYKGALTVEPGADATTDLSDFHGLMKTWRLFGSSIYGMGMAPEMRGRRWNEVQYGYFGVPHPPYFTFGKYSPSEDWTLWSGVPLE